MLLRTVHCWQHMLLLKRLRSQGLISAVVLIGIVAGSDFSSAQTDQSHRNDRLFGRHQQDGSSDDAAASNLRDDRASANQILQQALLESVWGGPIFCEVRQTAEMFGKKRTGFGKFVRGGKGSGLMRVSLQIPAGDQMNTLLQVSDGEILTTFLTVGQHISRTQVDLGKVRERLTLTIDSLQDPTTAMYLAIGGQPESLRKLLQQYDWKELREGMLGQQKVWLLKGSANTQPVLNASRAQIDIQLFEENAKMHPIQAALIIGHRESKEPFWLYQVEQWYQPVSGNRAPLYVVTEWDSPTRLSTHQMSPELFRFPSPEHQASQEIREETKLYLPPQMPNMATRPERAGTLR
jgi:hypothetical protein